MQLAYTDKCCEDKLFLEDVIPSLKLGTQPPLQKLKLPTSHNIRFITTQDACTVAVTRLRERLRDGNQVVGLDAEWTPPFKATDEEKKGKTALKVALLQLATDEEVLLIHLASLECLPNCVANLLSSTSILKVGLGIAADLTRIHASYPVDSSDTAWTASNFIDVGDMAKKIGAAARGSASLQDVVRSTLKLHLPKPLHLQIARWHDRACVVGAHQRYAALDAYACLATFRAMKPHYDKAQTKLPQELVHGTQVTQ